MNLSDRIIRNNFLIRLKSWEYWPFWVVQFPLIFYWLWLSLRARSFVFFSASNPLILLGGMFGESKYKVLKSTPAHLIPKTILIEMPSTFEQVMLQIRNNDLDFPLVFKPDIGERGHKVKRIFSARDVEEYVNRTKVDFIIQELVDLPVECGVFYTRFPNDDKGRATSLVLKEMLSVTGDGRSTLKELIFRNPRAILQWNRLQKIHKNALGNVLPEGEKFELNAIGNHCLGTKFLDFNHHITDELSDTFDSISKQIGEFYFGRFDLRCSSLDDLARGNVKIMEVNGCGAEPSHIYHPGFSLWEAYRVLFNHWKNLYTISVQNKKRGYDYLPLREGVRIYKHFRSVMNTP